MPRRFTFPLVILIVGAILAPARGEFDYYATSAPEDLHFLSDGNAEDAGHSREENDADTDYIEAAYGAAAFGDAFQKEYACGGGKDLCCCSPPIWTAYADALFLDRNVASGRVLFTDNFAGGAPASSLSDLNMDFETGYRVGLIRQRDCDRSLEISFFALDSWASSTSLAGAPFQFTQNSLYGVSFGDISDAVTNYGTDLYSVEVNLRRKRNDCVTWLAGFRFVELDESLTISDVFGIGGLEMFNTETRNYLYGGQVGADLKLIDRSRLQVNALAKAGLYYNRAKEFSNYDFLGTAGTDSKDDIAFLGELIFTANYKIRPGMALRAGYQVSWLDGVAMASEQFDSTDLTIPIVRVDTDGGLFYHGAFVGLELQH